MGELLDIAREDMRDFVEDSEGFSTTLSFTPTVGDPFELEGIATVHSQGIDSDGIPVIGDNSHIFFSEVSVNDLGYVTRSADGKVNIRDWKVTFDHAVGTVSAILSVTEPDSTFGMIRVMLTNFKQS